MFDIGLMAKDIRPMFVDYVEIEVLAGKGGHGCLSFHTEKFVPMGGPDGGNGGVGADIVAVADPNLTTLMDFRYQRQYKAKNGQPGSGGIKTGKSGVAVRLRLPTGTIVKDLETGDIVCDLDDDGAEFVLARGGRGGKGNHHFKSATNQAPRITQPGEPGETDTTITGLRPVRAGPMGSVESIRSS